MDVNNKTFLRLIWHNLRFYHLVFFRRRAPTRCSWRWSWTAPSWRAGPSGSRGRWRKRSRRINPTARWLLDVPAGAPARVHQRVRRRVGRGVRRRARWGVRRRARGRTEEAAGGSRNSLESRRCRPTARAPSAERRWIRTKSPKRKDWRRKRSPKRPFTSDWPPAESVCRTSCEAGSEPGFIIGSSEQGSAQQQAGGQEVCPLDFLFVKPQTLEKGSCQVKWEHSNLTLFVTMLSHLSEETTGHHMIIVSTIVEQAEKYLSQLTRLCLPSFTPWKMSF